MSSPSKRTFSSDFRQFFVRGLVVLLPSVLTLWLVVKAYQFIDSAIAKPINGSLRLAMEKVTPHWKLLQEFQPSEAAIAAEYAARASAGRQPKRAQIEVDLRAANIEAWWDSHWPMDLIGIVVAIVAVYIAGRLVGGFLGRRIYRRLERLITSIPVFKQVYPYVKQVVDFLFSDEQPIKFNRVVVIEYPRRGIWSVGFLTGETMQSIADRAGDSVTVFIPSSPTPFTGYTITVPREEVIEMPISVEEAMRFAVTGGVLVPDHQVVRRGGSELPDLIPVPELPEEQPPSPAASPEPGDVIDERRDAG
jgi:uncharacterized membrane protein